MHVFSTLSASPDPATSPQAARWYNHIQSYANHFSNLPGTSKAGEALTTSAPAPAPAPAATEEDDDVDLFGSDDEVDEEAERIKAERVAAYAAKKANKPKTIAKVCVSSSLSRLTCSNYQQSVVTLEVKPWDDETDMKALEDSVRSVQMEGLVWGASKLVPIGYGIRKLQITLVVGMYLIVN